MKSRPLRPTATMDTGPGASRENVATLRFSVPGSAPQRPRSGVTWTTDMRFTSRRWSRGWISAGSSGGIAARSASSPVIFSAYGRVASTASCARRIFTAATISMARVIFAVFCTLRMRRRICRRLATQRSPRDVLRGRHAWKPWLNAVMASFSASSASPMSELSRMA